MTGFWGTSIRRILGMLPSRDLFAYGFTFRWWFVGLIVARKADTKEEP